MALAEVLPSIDEVKSEDTQLGPNQGIIHTLDNTGDARLIWDRTRPVEVEAARALFDKLKGEQYTAYIAEGSKGEKGEIIKKFDPDAERIIMVPRMVGG